MSEKKLKLFIDASVFIAASASKEGGSAALFKICQKAPFTPVTTQVVLSESELNIKVKLGGETLGGIGLEWYRGKSRVFVISVSGKHIISYTGIFDGNKLHGSEYFEETLPLVIIQHLQLPECYLIAEVVSK